MNLEDIKNATFSKSNFGGYKSSEVDCFIDSVYSAYKSLQKENAQLALKIAELSKQLDKYREEESSIRNAIISAQKLADNSLIDADKKSRDIVFEASKKADEIVKEAENEVEKQKKIAWDMKIESENFRSKLIRFYEAQLYKLRRSGKDNEFFGSQAKNNSDDTQTDLHGEVFDLRGQTLEGNNILEVDFNKQENLGEMSTDSSSELGNQVSDLPNEKIGDSIRDIDSGIRCEKKTRNLKFGEKYRTSGKSFGKGFYSGFFKHKK